MYDFTINNVLKLGKVTFINLKTQNDTFDKLDKNIENSDSNMSKHYGLSILVQVIISEQNKTMDHYKVVNLHILDV